MDALVEFLLNFYGPTPYIIIFSVLLACGLGLPIPEDITLFAAGIMAYYGISNLWIMMGVSFFGVIIGDTIVFTLGAKYGKRLTKKWFFHKLLPDDRLERARTRLHGPHGNRLLFLARFMPGLRAPVYFSAGTLHVSYFRFWLLDGLAALISVPLIIGAIYIFGDEMDVVVRYIQRVEHGIVFVIFGAIGAILLKWYFTHRRIKGS